MKKQVTPKRACGKSAMVAKKYISKYTNVEGVYPQRCLHFVVGQPQEWFNDPMHEDSAPIDHGLRSEGPTPANLPFADGCARVVG